jgi:hypothetical protein
MEEISKCRESQRKSDFLEEMKRMQAMKINPF